MTCNRFPSVCSIAAVAVLAAACQPKATDQSAGGGVQPAVAGVAADGAATPAGADMIIFGGPILTMAGDAPAYVEAVAVSDGRIVQAGTKAEAMKLQTDATVLKDLAGKALLPGFVDAHGHVGMGGIQALSANLLAPPDGEVRDIPGLVATLRDWAAKNADRVAAVNLIIGFGYDNSQLKERRHPTKEELDQVSTTVPVLIVHQSSHLATLNSAALALVGYDSSTRDPEGGVIQRKKGTTEPNGTLEEVAWNNAAPRLLSGVGRKGLETFAREGVQLWARYGYTTAQEGRTVPLVAETMKKVAAEGGFPIDVAAYVDVLVDRDYIKANVSRDYVNHYRLAGAKLTIDGSPQGFTAWRDKPYYAPVGNYPKEYSGYPAAPVADLKDAVAWAFANDIQLLTHCSGEQALDTFIEGVTEAQEKHGRGDRRPVLIHGHFERPDQVEKLVGLGVIPSLFPMHTFYWGDWHYEHTVGPEAAQNISPTGWYRKAGSIFTTHHDAPVAFPDSMRVLDATVNRVSRSGRIIGPEQRVDTYTALRAMTIWPAYQYFEEGAKGSIEAGKLADFVVLSADPLKTEPRQLAGLKVLETIKEGRTVYSAR